MKITSSYGVEIRKAGGALSATLKTYREAVRVLALFYDTVWEDISAVEGEKKRFNYAEHLVHSTKKNHAVYDFDSLFPKMPSYLRRSAITHALGAVSSYRTRLVQWEEGGRKGKSPVLGEKTHAMPVFGKKGEEPCPRGKDSRNACVLQGKHVQGRRRGRSLAQALQRKGLGVGQGSPPSHRHGVPEEALDRREGISPDPGETPQEVLPAVLV